MRERCGFFPFVIPAKAGIHDQRRAVALDSRFRGNDGKKDRAR
jgi:hypothetical protein